MSAPLLVMVLAAAAPPAKPPTVDFEAGLGLGGDFVARSSRYALGDARPDEARGAFALQLDLGAAFPRAWLVTALSIDIGFGGLSRAIFQASDVPPLERSWGFTGALSVIIRPPWPGWVPFLRVFGGGTSLATNDRDPPPCDRRDFDRHRCPAGPLLDHVEYVGLTGGVGLGAAYQGLVQGKQGAVTFELRYAVTDWTNVEVEHADGSRHYVVELEGGERVGLGQGPSTLHQVGFLVGVRIGAVTWE